MPRTATHDEVVYAAGFFDGEGCVYLNALKNGGASLRVKVSQNNRKPLELLQEIWGGSICLAANKKKARNTWNLCLASASGERFLAAIRPYAIVKAEAIDIALEYRLIKKPMSQPGVGHRWNPLTDEEKEARLALRRRLHAVNSWADRPLKERVHASNV